MSFRLALIRALDDVDVAAINTNYAARGRAVAELVGSLPSSSAGAIPVGSLAHEPCTMPACLEQQ